MKGLIIAASAAILAMPVAASAHPGGLNAEGCHNNRKTGDYHCHGGGRSSSSPARPQGLLGSAPLKRDGGAYANCAEARAAGATPIRRGQPGYGPHLDRDGDGVGCERG
ncbi:excalibur calcium-binding domain-containing protein [Brevundimonas sp. M-11_2]|uniref:excalibur calcium-binding domain-containing protein n=2 Tax=unclassified Brevundimonas TaxID=2622653 RepID=UPI003F922090